MKLSRLGTVVSVVALGGGLLVGCSPEPEPTPTPTAAFASEEEAFAAAEEVYREYNDAGNQRRSGANTPNPQDYLVGHALEGDIEALAALEEAGLHRAGAAEIVSFEGVSAEIKFSDASISALVCLDAASTRVLDAEGLDMTPLDRPERVAQLVTFVGDQDQLLISSEASEAQSGCS